MAKAAEAFRTISEVADDLGIQKHVLRFWEVKFNQIRPMKRGGGRRYYRPADMELLRGIRQLLHRDGYTIKGVQKILREQGVEAVKERVRDNEAKREAAARQVQPVASPSRGAPDTAQPPKSRKKAGAKAGLIDRKAVLASIIAELVQCRDILAGRSSESSIAAKPGRRARRSA
jgi:DNA-binding transcriptional MerR regulator